MIYRGRHVSPDEQPITVECDVCHRTQLRWSNDHPNGLTLEEIYAIGWTFDSVTWRCPFCQFEEPS